MPKQVLPDETAFGTFEKKITHEDLGFREATEEELQSERTRQGLEPPYPREGREVCFVFDANGYRVVVWTTYLRTAKTARKTDAGRVLIREGDRALYHDHPKHRTKNFLYNLFIAAKIARACVVHRPLCQKCDAYMHIERGEGLKSRLWRCTMPAHSEEVVELPWDHDGLPPEILKEMKRISRIREPYRRKLAREGKEYGVAMLRRRQHKIKKPQNRV